MNPNQPGRVAAQLKGSYKWSGNARDCFPAWIDPDGPGPAPSQWAAFNKYLVTSVTAADPVGGSPNVVTNYTYNGTGAWAWTDAVVVPKRPAKNAYQSWDQWRGYQSVTTSVTGASGSQVTFYYRGMNGTKNNEATSTARVVNVSDAAGNQYVDDVWLGGRVLQSQTLLAGAVVASTVTGYWVNQTAPGSGGLPAHTAVMVRPNNTVATRPVTGGTQTLTTATTYTTDYGLTSQVVTSGTGITSTCVGSTYQEPTVGSASLLVDLPYRVSTFSGSDCSGDLTPCRHSGHRLFRDRDTRIHRSRHSP